MSPRCLLWAAAVCQAERSGATVRCCFHGRGVSTPWRPEADLDFERRIIRWWPKPRSVVRSSELSSCGTA